MQVKLTIEIYSKSELRRFTFDFCFDKIKISFQIMEDSVIEFPRKLKVFVDELKSVLNESYDTEFRVGDENTNTLKIYRNGTDNELIWYIRDTAWVDSVHITVPLDECLYLFEFINYYDHTNKIFYRPDLLRSQDQVTITTYP